METIFTVFVGLAIGLAVCALLTLYEVNKRCKALGHHLASLFAHFGVFAPSPPLPSSQVTALLSQQNLRTDAVRLYRQQTGLGQKEASDAVEHFVQNPAGASGEPARQQDTKTLRSLVPFAALRRLLRPVSGLRTRCTVPLLRVFAASCVAALLASCGGGDGESERAGKVFVFRLQGLRDTQEFRARTQSAAVITQARQQLQLPVAERRLFPIGPIKEGNGGYNLAWKWHFTDFELAEVTIELCDGTPKLLEEDLAYWLDTVKSFCPWKAYVHAELD
jgi:hypothetical protein